MKAPTPVLAVFAGLLLMAGSPNAVAQPRERTSRPAVSARSAEARKQAEARRRSQLQKQRQLQQQRRQQLARRQVLARGTQTTSPVSLAGRTDRASRAASQQMASATPAATPKPPSEEAASREAAVREVLELMTFQERQQTLAYLRDLTSKERQDLRQMMIPLTKDEERKTKVLELVASGRKPDSVEDLMRRVGLAPEPDPAPLTIAIGQGKRQQYSSKALRAGSSALPAAGQSAPALSLERLDGSAVHLADLKGKPVILELGSLTCPVYRSKRSSMAELKQKYGDRAEFLLVYTLEAHPRGSASPYSDQEWIPQKNLRDGVLKAQPQTLEQRRTLARELAEKHGEVVPIAVDSMDNIAWRALGARPNSALLIAPDGKVALAQEWTDPQQLEKALAKMLKGTD